MSENIVNETPHNSVTCQAVPLIRAIELLESHFERGGGVLVAVQARLARRQLARVTSEVSVR